VRSAPVVSHPWLYQGTFEWPSYRGHFRRYAVDQELAEGDDPVADWDSAGRIPLAMSGNADSGARQVFTAKKDQDTGTWSLMDFDTANVENLKGPLAHAADDPASTAEEIRVIERLRGLTWNWETLAWEETPYKLGAIMHSAPAIIRGGDKDSRFAGRSEVAYVGDLYGMLHAINTSNGSEKWAYIPSNLLPKLQNDRTDVNAPQDFAAVDGSPTVRDIYYDPDYNPDCVDEPDEDCHRASNRSWHTVLICTQGFGGTSIFALDVTDPDNWEVLWEATDTSAPGGGMGHAFRASLDRVKIPKKDPYDGTEIPGEYEPKWVVYVATSYAEYAETHGGINVFSFDLKTGDMLATFSAEYENSVNDIPGAITTVDYNGDTFADSLFVGDMNGRLWELKAKDLSNPHGVVATGDDAGKQIPLFDAGVENPISVSPAIVNRNGHIMVIFGTGGADWASTKLPDGTTDKYYYVYAVDATAANAVSPEDKTTNYYSFGSVAQSTWAFQLDAGEKVWSSPTISAGQLLVATAFGTMESADPTNDLDGGGKLRLLDLGDGSSIWKNEDGTDKHMTIGKVRGSLYVSRGHVYLTDIDGTLIRIGDPDKDDPGTGNRVVLRSWRNQ
jgi:outer membrane protein assembly factor BamB